MSIKKLNHPKYKDITKPTYKELKARYDEVMEKNRLIGILQTWDIKGLKKAVAAGVLYSAVELAKETFLQMGNAFPVFLDDALEKARR